MRLAVAVFLMAFMAWAGSALAHGEKEHSKAALPVKASSKTPDKQPVINLQKEEAGARMEHDDADGHHDKDGHHGQPEGESGEPAISKQHHDGGNNQAKMAIMAAQEKAGEAVLALRYRSTVMVFGFLVLVAGLAVRYLPVKGEADVS